MGSLHIIDVGSSPRKHWLGRRGLSLVAKLRPPSGYTLALDLTNPHLLAGGAGNRLTSGSSGTAVADIYDIDGVLRATQTTAGSRATWHPVDGLVATGSSWYTVSPAAAAGEPMTMICRYKRPSGLFVAGGGISGSPFLVETGVDGNIYFSGNTRWMFRSDSVTGVRLVGSRIPASGNVTFRLDGVQYTNAAATYGTTGTGVDRLLRRGANMAASGTALCALLVYPRALTDAEWLDAERYVQSL